MPEKFRKPLISVLVLTLSTIIVWIGFAAIYEPNEIREIPQKTFDALKCEFNEQKQMFLGGLATLSAHSAAKKMFADCTNWQQDVAYNRDHMLNPIPVREPDWFNNWIRVPELFLIESIPGAVKDIAGVPNSLAKWLLIGMYASLWLIAMMSTIAALSGEVPFQDRLIASVIGITVFVFGIQIVEFILKAVNIIVFIAVIVLFIVGVLCFYVGKDWLREKLESGFSESLAETLEPMFLGKPKQSAAEAESKAAPAATVEVKSAVSPQVSKLEKETPPKRKRVKKAQALPKEAGDNVKRTPRNKPKPKNSDEK